MRNQKIDVLPEQLFQNQADLSSKSECCFFFIFKINLYHYFVQLSHKDLDGHANWSNSPFCTARRRE